MSLTNIGQELVPRLERNGQSTLEFFQAISDEQWQFQIYFDGPGWRVHNIFAHLTEVETSIPRLVRGIAKGGEGVAENFDIDHYNKEHVEEISQLSREGLFAEYPRRRLETIELVKSLEAEDFRKRGRHPYLGESEIGEMLRLMLLHSRIHERDVRKALDSAAKDS